MEAISITLLLMLAVVASSALARMSPMPVPLPLVQIALGALVAWTFDFHVVLQPDIFFLAFLPPLLFLDGWRIPKEGLLRDKGTIIALALGLVVFTVIGAGYFIHWMIPAMPLAVAFALAATLSPTDAVGVSAIAARTPFPKRLMHILEGESLLNDASGLVCMRFAVVAALTGGFSLVEASGVFLWLAAGGIGVGVLITWSAARAKDWVSQRFGEETGSQILISLLIPFGAYVAAESIQASGILAAVAAGIVMGYEEKSGRALATTRVRRAAVWDAVAFAGNGMIFVLLGEQLPSIVAGAARVAREAGQQEVLWLLAYVLGIACALAALRFLWVWASLALILFRAARKRQTVQAPGWSLIAATSLAGVRGAITLAGVLTLPFTLQDGSPFPARDLAIFLAAGVIVVSLVAANVGLPYLIRHAKLPPEASSQKEEDAARVAAAQAAIEAIDRRLREMGAGRQDADLYMGVASRIMVLYRQRIEARSKTGEEADASRKDEEIERSLRLVALHAERAELYRIARSGKLPEETTRKLVREVDLLESRFSTP
ncbi:Na+/H+ antiporter [Rhizobium sp. BK251]|uniref:Na+/H+ antiporter n=1 Tax=Rhizobium sp. BK251 TaxID=2512125 RepID=UPI001050B72E|nr:Na+/H+ antiporter [Rhizobium sp. BK251]TCL76127.1 sodium/proton antiporter (CPA1 family) [Rhizobium sp. BK251]